MCPPSFSEELAELDLNVDKRSRAPQTRTVVRPQILNLGLVFFRKQASEA